KSYAHHSVAQIQKAMSHTQLDFSHAQQQSLGTSPGMVAALCCPLSASEKRQKFLHRLVHFRHMDFEYALWQMFYLFVSPQKVYRNFQYRKQTRNQWARDDPAFLVLLSTVLLGTSLVFGLVLRLSFLETLKLMLWIVCIDCIGVGVVIATIFWLLANRVYRLPGSAPALQVEWAYAFDVHLNAFFPLLVILHLIQLPFLYPVLYHDWFVSSLLGNLFWLVAIVYYLYITFLGYRALSFLRGVNAILYPITLLCIVFLVSVLLRWNFTKLLADFYKFRIR
ncbi:hypothetical protein BOX15_Mlig002281g2, partial [Macrostomum lignano]